MPTVREQGKEARKSIVWSYSVQWEQSDVAWASRWDTYLSTDDPEIHWFSIINSLVTVLFLSGRLACRLQPSWWTAFIMHGVCIQAS
jgi:hypothetical protein